MKQLFVFAACALVATSCNAADAKGELLPWDKLATRKDPSLYDFRTEAYAYFNTLEQYSQILRACDELERHAANDSRRIDTVNRRKLMLVQTIRRPDARKKIGDLNYSRLHSTVVRELLGEILTSQVPTTDAPLYHAARLELLDAGYVTLTEELSQELLNAILKPGSAATADQKQRAWGLDPVNF